MSSETVFPGAETWPVELTRFVGRAAELNTLARLAANSRLLTITGAGGSGKTRLTQALIPQLEDLAPDGIYWIELASLTDAALLPAHVAHGIGLGHDVAAGAPETLVRAIADRRLLLALDNCEHLVDACAALADRLLRENRNLRVIATSREALGVRGERAWLVPPMGVANVAPELQSGAVEGSVHADSVTLFLDRAQEVLPSFQLTDSNAAAVSDICARLDGVPLAIELAAARVRHMTPEQIRDRLTDVFALLTTSSRTVLPRHRTLRATLDWSYEQLSEHAKRIFRWLAVFRGGFTLDALESLTYACGLHPADPVDTIAQLVDRSLIVLREHANGPRYHLLEPTRQYAALRLGESGRQYEAERALSQHFCSLLSALESDFTTTQRKAVYTRLEVDHDNIRTALAWTLQHEPELHARFVGDLWWFWFSSRDWQEAGTWIHTALQLPAASTRDATRARLLFAAGALASLRAQPDASHTALEEAQAIADELGDRRLSAYIDNYQALTYAQSGRSEALLHAARAERWFRAQNDMYGLRLSMLLIGFGEQAAGRTPEAITAMQEAIDIASRSGQDRELAIAQQSLAMVMADDGDLAGAEKLLLESLHALRRDPSELFTGRAIECLAVVGAARNPREAATRLGMADAIRRGVGAERFEVDQRRVDALVPRLIEILGKREFDSLRAGGAAHSTREALEIVFSTSAPASREADVSRPVPEAGASGAASPDLRVLALGDFVAEVAGVPVRRWTYAKPKELLVYLLLNRRGRTRQEITAALWPEATPAQARNNFHVTLHNLRKTLGHPGWIELVGSLYRVSDDVAVDFDVARFEVVGIARGRGAGGNGRGARGEKPRSGATSAVGDSDVLTAVSLYRGHLLAGEAAGPWRDDESDRLRRIFVEAALTQAGVQEDSDPSAAAELYERVVTMEPLQEDALRKLLRLRANSGERGRALRVYERFAEVLRSELDMEPEAETVALVEELRSRRL